MLILRKSCPLDGVLEDDWLIHGLIPVIRVGIRDARQSHVDPGLVGEVDDDLAVAIDRAGRQKTPDRADARVVAIGHGTAFDAVDPALQSLGQRDAISPRRPVFGPDQVDGTRPSRPGSAIRIEAIGISSDCCAASCWADNRKSHEPM